MDWGELRGHFTNWAGRVVRLRTVAAAKSDGTGSLAGRAVAGEQQTPPQARTRFIAPFGFRSVPPADLEVVELCAYGASDRSMSAPLDSARYGPNDLATDGSEAAFYNKDNPRALVATGAHGVIVDQGDKKVATDTTPVTHGTLGFVVIVNGSGALTSLAITYTPGDGSMPQALTLALGSLTGTLTLHESIDGGSPNFKAPGP